MTKATAFTDAWVNWCEGPTFLDGLSAFTVECFLKRTTNTTEERMA